MTIQTRIGIMLSVMVIGVGCSTPPQGSFQNEQALSTIGQEGTGQQETGQGGTVDDSIASDLSQETPTQQAHSSQATGDDASVGQLTLTANGEDFVRQGLVSRDGWAIAFDHAYLTVTDVVASQSAQDSSTESSSKQMAIAFLDAPVTIDLAGPSENPAASKTEQSNPVAVVTQTATTGHYDALSWSIVPEKASDTDYGLKLVGKATQADQTVLFDIQLDPSYRYDCGEFIGDTRKGFVTAEQDASIEMTIHLDHLFGDGSQPAEDEINTDSLGFTPLAAIAEDGQLSTDMATLATALSPADYATLTSAITSLGHVGEGHCTATKL